MNHNRNAHYWENRDERKERAYLHTKNMAYVFSDHIEQCVRNTKLYDDTNTFDELNPVLTREVSVVDLDTVSAIFRYKRKEKKDGKFLTLPAIKMPAECFYKVAVLRKKVYAMHRFYTMYYLNSKTITLGMISTRIVHYMKIEHCILLMLYFTNDSVGTLCDVITCAAPNKSAAQKYCHVSDEENYNALESRIRFVLHIAEKKK